MGFTTRSYAGGTPRLGIGRGNSTPVGAPVEPESPKEPEPSLQETIEEVLEKSRSQLIIESLASLGLLKALENCRKDNIEELVCFADLVLEGTNSMSSLQDLSSRNLSTVAKTIKENKQPTIEQLSRIGFESGLAAELFVKQVIKCANEETLKFLSEETI